MEPVLQQIMAEVNGRYTLSNILDVLDKLRRAKRLDIDQYDKVYKHIIKESRKEGDKWYQRYVPIKQIKELNSLNFSFDVKTSNDENIPNQSNRSKQNPFEKLQKLASPTTFASPPTFETRASRITEFQSDHQKELTNQILQQISDGKRRSAQSDYVRSDKQIKTNRTYQSISFNGVQQLISIIQRKIMQQYRGALNKILYIYNEPVRLVQDVEIQAEPQNVVKFVLKDTMYIEKGIADLEERRTIRILFNHFDNLKQYWIKRRNLKIAGNKVLAMRKYNYVNKAFQKLHTYAINHKKSRLSKCQADHFYKLKNLHLYFDRFIQFHQVQLEKKGKYRVSSGFIQLKNNEIKQICFSKLKNYYSIRRQKHQNNLLAYGLYQQKLQKLYFGLWSNLVQNLQKRETNQIVLRKCLSKWKQYLQLKEYNRKQKELAYNNYNQISKKHVFQFLQKYHQIVQIKIQTNQNYYKIYLTNLKKRGLYAFKQFVVIQYQKEQLNQQVEKFLQTIYLSKPFNILIQYKKERQMKKELNVKALAIYQINKTRKLIIFWQEWTQQKKYHRKRDKQIKPLLKTLHLQTCFSHYRKAFKQSLWLKNLARIMKSKYSKEFMKELKLINIQYKQQNKYPLKLKQRVFSAFRINLINHLKKKQFHQQLLALHEHNMVKHIFEYMHIRGINHRQKMINKRSVQRSLFGKYLAGPFYFLQNYTKQHSYKRSIQNSFDKLHIIKVYQKVFQALNDYKWRKKMQKLKDNKNYPIMIKNQKIKYIRFWNSKKQSKSKIENFCQLFQRLQKVVFFKHMNLIKVRDYQKKKYMAQGRIFYLQKFAFNQLNKYKIKKLKQRNNTEVIKKRSLYHTKKNAFKHMRRLFTFEQNVAYLTAVTILQIKKNLLQKYFKGFKELIQNKKRPRDQVMKQNKLKKCFAGWKKFTTKQQGVKLLLQSIQDVNKRQKKKFFSKTLENQRLMNADIYSKENLLRTIIQSWYQSTQSSQKTTYLVKVLNKLRVNQLRQQFSNLHTQYQISILEENLHQKLMKISFLKWHKKFKKQSRQKDSFLFLEQKLKQNCDFAFQALKENSKEQQILESANNKRLRLIFKFWRQQKEKNQQVKKIINSIQKKLSNIQTKVFQKLINKVQIYNVKFSLRQSNLQFYFKKWFTQHRKIEAAYNLTIILSNFFDAKNQKLQQKLFKINRQDKFESILRFNQTQKLFSQWQLLKNKKQILTQFTQKIQKIFDNKIYNKFCQNKFFYNLQSLQMKQLKGEFALRSFDKILFNRKQMILDQFKQEQVFSNFVQDREVRKQILCFTMWAKLTNLSIAYKFICKSLVEVYKRNMFYNLGIIQQYGEEANKIVKVLNDKKKKQVLQVWQRKTQKRIGAKIIFETIDQKFYSQEFQSVFMQHFMGNLKNHTKKSNQVSQLFEKLQTKFRNAQKKNLTKLQQQTRSKNFNQKWKLRQQKKYLKIWKQKKATRSICEIFDSLYLQNLGGYLNKFRQKTQKNFALNYFQNKQKKNLLKFLKLQKENTKEKANQLQQQNNSYKLNIIFQTWIVECLKRNNQRKCIQRICKGFFLHHYRTYGFELMKQLRLEKKLQQKAEIETQQSLKSFVFKAWKMIVDERKMLKKYLQECSPEEKRGKSTPKNLPY